MTDYWEALGRLVCNPALTDKFLAQFPDASTIPAVDVDGQTGLKIPTNIYGEVQDFFAPVLANGILGAFSAGELYWTLGWGKTVESIRGLNTYFTRQNALADHSTGFFVALGAILIDPEVRKRIRANIPVFKNRPQMSSADVDLLARLCKDDCFIELCEGVDSRWPPPDNNCIGTLLVKPQTLHSLAIAELPGHAHAATTNGGYTKA